MTEPEVVAWYARAQRYLCRHGLTGDLAAEFAQEMVVDLLRHTGAASLKVALCYLHAVDRLLPRREKDGVRWRQPVGSYTSTDGGPLLYEMDFETLVDAHRLAAHVPAASQPWVRLLVAGWTLSEIARHEGVTPGAMTQRMQRLRHRLEGALHELAV